MFVLITSECEILSSTTKVELFATHEDAHAAMVDAAYESAYNAGIEPNEFFEYIDCLDDDEGYIAEVVGWQIRELPDTPITEFDGWCPVCGGEVSCMLSDYDHEEYECDECGASFSVGHVITSIYKKEN
jgi:predicted RNA-binding Zn-ribbon protein involved in translation (DUF1610 family)